MHSSPNASSSVLDSSIDKDNDIKQRYRVNRCRVAMMELCYMYVALIVADQYFKWLGHSGAL